MGKDQQKCTEEKWLVEVQKYKEVRAKLNIHIPNYKLSKNAFGLRSANWYIFNAPLDTKISTYNEFVVWCGFPPLKHKWSRENLVDITIQKNNDLKRPLKLSDFSEYGSTYRDATTKYFGGFNSLKTFLGLDVTGTFTGISYTKEKSIEVLRDYIETNKHIPTLNELEHNSKLYGLPSRKTLTKFFDHYADLIEACGSEYCCQRYTRDENGEWKDIYHNKEKIKETILEYINKHNEVPTVVKMKEYLGFDLRTYCRAEYGSWNNCLKELDLKLNSVTQYTESELDTAFLSFVQTHNRVPTIQDFNKTGLPSFWVYQQRFGGWAKACMHYGYKPNCRDEKFYMDDGEICASAYEYDITMWLKKNSIEYERDVLYIDFIDNYKGKMNCDYKFVLPNNDIWYVEMAGFINTYEFSKLKQRPEQLYFFKLQYKKKLLKRQNCNYLIISPNDLKTKSMGEIFYFLNVKEKDVLNGEKNYSK